MRCSIVRAGYYELENGRVCSTSRARMIRIKKYSNRRLYDTSRSAYINLEDLAQLIRDGEEVAVEDAKSSEDLTRSVLMQVLLELPGTLDSIPVAMFHRLIRYGGGEAAHPFVTQQLAVGFDLMEAQLAAFEAQFGWGAAPEAAKHAAEPPPPPYSAGSTSPAPDPELDALRKQLAELEARLDRR